MRASRGSMAPVAILMLLLAARCSAQTPEGDCPVKYAGQTTPLLFGGVIGAQCKRSNGQQCTRAAKW